MTTNIPIPKVDKEAYLLEPDRYELRPGTVEGAPLCPYGNHYQWIGYDKHTGEYLRFTKSVFKKMITEQNQSVGKNSE
jgi:hypothetical protein